jgi:hypothetical protein
MQGTFHLCNILCFKIWFCKNLVCLFIDINCDNIFYIHIQIRFQFTIRITNKTGFFFKNYTCIVSLNYTVNLIDNDIKCAFEIEKKKQTIPKNRSRYTKKLCMLNVIKQLQHFILCNMMCFVKLLCHLLFVFVWCHCKGHRKRLAGIF